MLFNRKVILAYKWLCIVAGFIYALAAAIDVMQNYALAAQYEETPSQIYVAMFVKELVYSTFFVGTAILIELVERLVLRAQKLSLEDMYS